MYDELLEKTIAQIVFHNPEILKLKLFDQYDFFSKEKQYIEKMIKANSIDGIINEKTIGKYYDVPDSEDVLQITDYTRTLKEYSLDRKLQKFTEYSNKIILNNKYNSYDKIDKIIDKLRSFKTTKGNIEDYHVSNNIDDIIKELSNDEPPKLLKTGFEQLDLKLGGGLCHDDFIIFAADPGNYKSTLAANICMNVINEGKKVFLIDYEMGKRKVYQRILSMTTDINTNIFKNKTVNRDGELIPIYKDTELIEKINEGANELRNKGLYVIHGRKTVDDIVSMALKVKPDLIIFDFIQIMPDLTMTKKNSVEANAELAYRLKELTSEDQLGCPVIALSQFSKNKDTNFDGRRSLNDLYNSNMLRAAIDIGIITYDKKQMEDGKRVDKILIQIDKNRTGDSSGDVTLPINKKRGKIYNIS